MSVAVLNPTEAQERRWLTNFREYARDQLFIQPMMSKGTGQIGGTALKSLTLNAPQRLLDSIINEIRQDGRLVRIIILKARREGVSTYVSGRFYWHTTTKFNRYSVLITHEPEATEFLFQMHKRFYQHNPVWQPQTTYNNKKMLMFDTVDGKGLGSAIRVATAGKEDIGSGQAIHYLHLSEMAKWPAHTTEAIMASVSQCVQAHPDTEVIIESTAKGASGEFHDRYWDARYHYEVTMQNGAPTVTKRINKTPTNEHNEFCAVFLPWFIFDEYCFNVPQGFVRTPKEEELVRAYNLTDGQLAWRRWCIANNCGGDENIFMQEYPSCASEAFLTSGDPVFNTQQIVQLMANAPKPKMRYNIQSDGQFIAEPESGDFLVWEEPKPGEEYTVSGDVGEGIHRNTGGNIADYSCAMVWKTSTGEQVAEWHGKEDPDLFGVRMVQIGMRYNTAFLVPERNNHGNATALKIVDMRYPRIYVERVPEPPNKIRKRFGWLTTRGNKMDIVNNLLAEVRDGTHGIKSKECFREMLTFKKEGQEYGADVGKFDDRVITAAIGKFTLPMLKTGRVRKDSIPTFQNVPTPEGPPPGSWMV